MRAFACPRCRGRIGFEDKQCLSCDQDLGFHRPSMQLVAITGESVTIDGRRWLRCSHHELGCNWLAADDSERGRCFPDSFVRNGPAPDDSEAMRELGNTLRSMRRLIFQLLDLGLPIVPYYLHRRGLAFDLLSSKSLGHPVTIGHSNGVITIDLTESLELYRERQRIHLGEAYRTMLGHFRHEVGHYYEMILAGSGPLIEEARTVFGDERQNYAVALQHHYNGIVPANWQQNYISEYATAHPWEDWAETFAHYLHITGTLATIGDSGLVLNANAVKWNLDSDVVARTSYRDCDIHCMVDDWVVLSGVLNRVNHSMGEGDLYPFTIAAAVVKKLGFVHRVLTGARGATLPNT